MNVRREMQKAFTLIELLAVVAVISILVVLLLPAVQVFLPVCHAIQHAHQKGIIHRDIKPSNILVSLYDGQPVPKVIDFGVAKAIQHRLTSRTSRIPNIPRSG